MYDKSLVNSLFEKAKTKITSVISLDELAYGSFDEFCKKVGDTLNYTESQLLYGAAEEAYQYKTAERRKRLVRANPQLQQAKSLDIQPLESHATEKSSHRTKRAADGTNKGDEDRLLNRDHQYVPAGHVASMFSPAAYLAELYKNARYLHDDENARSLKKRRPDLVELVLNQDNLDNEVSLLSLSNEILFKGCQRHAKMASKEGLLKKIAGERLTGSTPYHHAFQTLRYAIRYGKSNANDILATLSQLSYIKPDTHQASIGLLANIDPELYKILIEEVTEQNVDALFEKNFGTKWTPAQSDKQMGLKDQNNVDFYQSLCHPRKLADYYDMREDLVEKLIPKISKPLEKHGFYVNDKLTTFTQSSSKVFVETIVRTNLCSHTAYGGNGGTLHYANLIPKGENKYKLIIKPKAMNYPETESFDRLVVRQLNDLKSPPTIIEASSKDTIKYDNTKYGEGSSNEIVVDNLELKNGDRFTVQRATESGGLTSCYWGDFRFSIRQGQDVRFFLLELNKLLRLSKATSLSPTEIERIILAHNTEMNVDASVIASLFGVVRYKRRYNLSTEEAVILCGASISQHPVGEIRSQFDRLFNPLPLNKNNLTPDNKLGINFNPDDKDNQDWKSVLKQAFQVNDDALLFMAGSEKCTLSLSNLTQLYFIHLLARVHDLTINQTVMLLKILGYNPEDKNKWKPNNFTTIVEVVYQATQWLSEEALTVEQLFLMTTTTFSSQQTPQMTTLVKELRDNKTDDKALYTAMSRSVATALGISNLNVTENILIWLDTVTPTDKLNCKQFIEESKSEESKTTIKLSDKMIDFCQRVGQLAMIVQWLKLDELETTLIARYPKKVMGDSVTSIPVTLTAFRQLSHLRRFLSQCGRSAPAVTTALVEDNLTLDLLAGAIGEEKNTLQAAGQQHIDAKISDFSKINDILHVLYLGKALGVSPLVVQSLQSLTYDSNYQNIQWVADSLLAGLEASARQSVNNALEENLSAALSAYYIRSVLPGKGVSWVNSRDDLYQYLLIDNQVSSDTKTSPISAAITSIQLYVNNCLYGQEADVSVTGRVRPFFADWARCNKRYSQWAAVKQLIYFPENYLDPTQRVGQTGMMDKLLRSLNQGPLNKDTVEDAFKTYLTDFEQIANLSVITGYHDGLNTDRGLTYFIGATQAEPVEYYWRTVDQSQRKDGKFPASAWGEWKKIDTAALQPMGELIRPVMFNSRLHILWVERQQKAEQKNGATTPFFDYAFKLAYLRHDGTWSTPFNFPFSLNGNLKACEKATASVNDLSLYCAPWFSQDKLIIIIYKKDWILNKENKKEGLTLSGEGLFVTQDMTHTQMGEKDITSICTAINTELSTKKIRRINNQYDDVTASSITDRNNYQWGDYNLSMIYGSSLEGIKLSSQESAIKVTLSPVVRIIHNGHEGLARHQCNLMKKYGQMGDKFLIFNQINKNPDHATADATIVPIVQYKGNKSNNAEERFLFYTDVSSANNAHVWVNQKRGLHLISTSDHYGCIKDDKNSPEDYKNYIFMTFHDASKKYAIDIMNPIEIDTTIKSSSITMTMEFGTTKESRVSTTWSPDNLEESTIRFSEFDIDIPDNLFINNRVDVKFTFSAKAKDGRFVGSETFIIPITRKVVGIENVMSLHTTADGAQYLELQCYRTRLNTLFAKQLLSRADRGIDAILSLSTQKLPEHQLGEGTYATITLKKYDPDIYGTNKTFNLWLCDVYKPGDKFSICGGELSEYTTTAIKIFLPRLENAFGNPDNLYLSANYQKGPTPGIRLKRTDTSNPHGWVLDKTYNDGTFSGLENVSGLDNINEVMDFTGSNTLYFWEMFYYVPMLVTRRLLQEQQFNEAARWLRYVYSPDGYTIYGQHDARHWNTRPLLEDTGWNAVPENFTDPDALAQHDPMHYKLAAVMCQLDLLIARGDVAYRMLERDTLAEAMVWYQQALLLLGHAPSAPSPHHWTTPALAVINEAEFSPQENARLKSYRQTLAQRIYNLRHNLNIDGQPLFLPLYAKPANPQDLRSALVVSTGSSPALPKNRTLSLYRFPLMLERARSMVSQLSQFGSLLSNILERQDAEALSALMQNQAKALFMMSAGIQNQTLEELIAEKEVLVQQQTAARQRLEHYQGLYEENINAGENDAMATRLSAGHKALTATGLHIVAAGLDLAPNIFGLSVGGSRWGALATAGALGANIWSSYEMNNADNTTLKESYRRRREEWDIQRKTAQTDVNQLEAQMKAHDIRCEAAVMQKTYLETQQKQAQEQLEFLQRKFSNQALYSWLRGRLSAIYYQFYDLTMSRCLMAEAAYHYEVKGDPLQTPQFIKPGAWQSAHAGLLCGEALTLNLAQMENDYLKWESRALEVTRTVCLSEVYAAQFTLSTKVVELVNKAEGTAGNGDNTLKFNDNQLQATLKLSDLKMNDDYPANLGQVRRIKQISVTLPALVGPYQDVRAVLSYEGSLTLPRGCRSLAVSHGMNDNGQFQLDFNDGKFLPFESIPVNDSGVFTLSFPQATDKQKALLLSLSDIILHIRYTIRD